MSPTAGRAEAPVALVLTILGMALTTWAAFTHSAHLVVPGATLITVGGAWLGNALARGNVRLFPFFPSGEHPASDPTSNGKD
jgi:hypothetical protein